MCIKFSVYDGSFYGFEVARGRRVRWRFDKNEDLTRFEAPKLEKSRKSLT
jgi:hypothetical protein